MLGQGRCGLVGIGVSMWVWVCMLACMWVLCGWVFMHACGWACECACVTMHSCMCMCQHERACIRAYACVCMCVHVRVCVCVISRSSLGIEDHFKNLLYISQLIPGSPFWDYAWALSCIIEILDPRPWKVYWIMTKGNFLSLTFTSLRNHPGLHVRIPTTHTISVLKKSQLIFKLEECSYTYVNMLCSYLSLLLSALSHLPSPLCSSNN